MPFANERATSRATSKASLVFPLPPAPVRTTKRDSRRSSSARSAASSLSRPTSGFGGTGSLHCRPARRRIEFRGLLEDAALKLAQRWAGLETELLVESRAQRGVVLERVRLSSRLGRA